MSLQVLPSAAPPRKPRGRVEILHDVPLNVAEEFLTIYRDAFEPLKTKSPARQWLTDDEFRHEMSDPSVLKFVARAQDDEIVAMALMSTNLDTVPWISQPYFAAKYPEHYADGNIFYIGAMLVRPERQGGPWAKYLLDHIFHFFGERRGVGCFDCCSFNVETVALPDLIVRAGHSIIEMDLEILDQQTYYGGTCSGFKRS
jgi:ribosomal protein S18 acetylase RimI-like enzyme